MPGMICVPQPLAVEEVAKVLASGGNAFDVVVTYAVVQFLVNLNSCGIGGCMVMTSRLGRTSQFQLILDAPALAGSRVAPDIETVS